MIASLQTALEITTWSQFEIFSTFVVVKPAHITWIDEQMVGLMDYSFSSSNITK